MIENKKQIKVLKSRITRETNRLNVIEKGLNVYKEFHDVDVPITKFFNKYIKDTFFISLSTYRKWLGINVKKEREKIENKKIELAKLLNSSN
jgi:hypothetical protein